MLTVLPAAANAGTLTAAGYSDAVSAKENVNVTAFDSLSGFVLLGSESFGSPVTAGPGCNTTPEGAWCPVRCSTTPSSCTQQTLSYPGQFSVDLGGGDDVGVVDSQFEESQPEGSPACSTTTACPIDLLYQGGTGNDHMHLIRGYNFRSVAMLGGPGDDEMRDDNELIAVPPPGVSGSVTVDAGPGNDDIYAEAHIQESITCGEGNDFVHGAGSEDFVAADCESGTDTTPPTITLTSPTDGASYSQDQVVKASYSCLDTQSPPVSCLGTVAKGSPIDTSSVGEHTFKIIAVDASPNHNQAVLVVTYTVGCDIKGTDGPDALRGTNKPETICGLGGDDRIDGMGGKDQISGGPGFDALHGGDGPDSISGGSENDSILGDAGNDHLDGGAGADRLRGGSGDDNFNGGPGVDNAFYLSAPAALRGSLAKGVITGEGNDRLKGIEQIRGSPFADVLVGDAGYNELVGGGGGDSLDGGGGADYLDGGAGDDRILGNGGPDLLVGGIGRNDLDGGGGDDVCYSAHGGQRRSCETP